LWSRCFDGVGDLREALLNWLETYNTCWLIERLSHRSPRETYAACLDEAA